MPPFVVVRDLRLFVVVVVNPSLVQAGKEERPGDKNDRHDTKRTGSQFAVLAIAEFHIEAEISLIHAGHVKPGGSADFVLTIKVRMVPIRIFANAFVRQPDQIGTFANDHSFLRTDVNAGRLLTSLDPIKAHGAFADLRIPGVEKFVGGDAERAGDHTVAAADTDILIVGYRPFRLFGKRFDQTGGGAGRFDAMHALRLNEYVFPLFTGIIIPIHHRVVVSVSSTTLLKDRVVMQIKILQLPFILVFAGLLAPSAILPETKRGID